jgi:hypothetical protein
VNEAISKEEWESRKQQQKQFFDGVKRGANDAALAMTNLSEKQKAVAQIVIEMAKAYKVDPAFALAIAQQESGFNQLAKSAVGARGVMQLMPGTAKQLGVNFNDLNDNIKGGVMYLAQQEKQFKSLRLAAAAYNAGPGNVQKFGGVPPFKETQNYVVSVGALYEKWQKVLGAQGESFTSAKDQADELGTAFNRLKTHQDDQVKKAEEYAKVQVEQIKTRLAAMDQERQAAADVAAQELAGAKTYQQKADIIEAAQQKAAAYNAEALDMVRAEFDAQEAVIKARQAALANELAQADQYNVTIDEQFKLKQALRAADNDLAILAQNRAQAEIAASGKANEFAQKAISLKQGEASAIDGIIGAYQRQLDILTRLTAAKEAGASADQLSLLNDFYQSADALPELVSPDQIARMEQYTLSTKALKGAVDELTGAQKKNEEQSVKEAQLRMNAYWDQTIGRIREYAKLMEEITGQKNPWVDMSVGVMEYAKSVDQISSKYDDLQKQWRKQTGAAADQTDSYLSISEALEQGQAAAALMAQTMLTARQNTEKGSQAYKNLTTAAENFMVVQQLLNVAEGIGAVIKQLKEGDPYTAAIRAAGTAMILASMGISTGFGGGSSSQSSAINRTGIGGGVFGGTGDEASNSIADSIEIIKQNSNTDINYSAAMLRALQGIESAMAGVTNQVIRGVGPNYTGKLGLLKDASSFLNPTGFSSPLQSLGMKMTFSQTAKIVGYGIQSWAQSLNEILKKGFKAVNFTDIEKTTKVFMMTVSKKISTNYTELDNGVTRQITKVFRSIADALTEGADAFGISSEDAMKRMGRVKLDFGKIDFANMSGEEIQKKLSEVFSSMTDTLAKKLMPGLKDFIQLGEGYAKTFFRLADASNRVSVELARLGVDMIAMKDITEKNGDVAKEWVKQSLMAQDGLSANIKQFIDDASAAADSAEELASTYRQIIQANNLMRTSGLDTSGLGYTMTNAAGGLNEFIAAMESFNENFLSEADRYSGDVRNLTEQFGRLGYALPDSKEAFAAMVLGIDTSTEAGQKLFGQMIALSDSFAKVADEAQRIKDKYADILDPFKKFSDQINQVGKDFGTLIGGLTGESKGRISTIENAAAKLRGTLTGNRSGLSKELADQQAIIKSNRDAIIGYQERLDKELAKKPKNQNKALIKKLESYIQQAESSINGLLSMSADVNDRIAAINQQIAQVDAQEGIDKAAESARLALEKQAIIDDAVTSMGATLEDVFSQIVQTVQASQQRLQSVVAVQKSLASQLAQLQGPGAVFDLANADRNNAFGAIDNYILGVQGGAGRNVETEVGLLNDAQSAVMARYNAEIAAIQDAEREYIAAETDRLNASLQAQIDAINAATDAAIQAENDRLDAAVKAQQKIDEAEQKALQKSFDAANKLTQKQFDAEQKLLQKQFDAEQKALQKAHDAQLQNLQDELDAATKLKDAIKGIAEYARGMALGGNSPLSPEQRLAEAQRQYQELLARAQGGDAEAMGKLTGASDAYLEASKAYYGSGTQYANTFDAVKNAMSAIGGMSAPDPDSIQSRIDALREAQAEEMDALRELQSEKLDALRESQADRLDAIREAQADQLDALREQQQEQLDAMRKASQLVQDGIREAAQSQIEELQKQTQQAIADLSDPNKNAAMKAARESAEAELKKLQELAELTRIEAQKQADEAKAKAEQMARDALDLANKQLAELQAGTRVSRDTVAALNAILINAKLNPIPGYANGGLAGPGLAMVGERGPELVRFNRPGQVINANDTRSMLADDQKIVAAIAELKAEMRAVVVTQSNANPQIIDKLSGMEARLSKMERTQRFNVGA